VKTFNEVYKDSGLGKWFHKQSAGGEPGWDRYDSTGKKAGKCGDAKDGEPYAACLSKQKVQKLGKKGVASFVNRKRKAQKTAGKPDKGDGGKGAKPVNVKTGVTDKDPKKKGIQEMKSFQKLSTELQEKNKPTNPKLWSSVISQAKSKFDVYPSAYANAWASKEYKKKGGGWRSTSESVNEITVESMDHGKALKVYEKLKKGSKVTAEFGNAMSVNYKPRELVVTSPHRIVGKSKVGRIFLKNPDGKGVKYTLFNRDGKISLAQGDMGTIMKDLKIMKEDIDEGLTSSNKDELAARDAYKSGKFDAKLKEYEKLMKKYGKASLSKVPPKDMMKISVLGAELRKARLIESQKIDEASPQARKERLAKIARAAAAREKDQAKEKTKATEKHNKNSAKSRASAGYITKDQFGRTRKEEVECGCEACTENDIIEKMDPTDHVVKKNGKFAVVNVNGKTLKTFDDKEEADAYAIKFHDKLMNKIEEKSAAWQRNAGKNKEGGLNAKGRASYERENPGSDLKAPVSAAQAKKSGKGGKAANRRKSFCARMGGMPGPMKDEKGRPTRKALALRKWDC
jgi:hypothetical protein